MGYQIAFDLYDSATQQFLGRVLQAVRVTAPLPELLSTPVSSGAEHTADGSPQTAAQPATASQLVSPVPAATASHSQLILTSTRAKCLLGSGPN